MHARIARMSLMSLVPFDNMYVAPKGWSWGATKIADLAYENGQGRVNGC